jgi:hypothetical protein
LRWALGAPFCAAYSDLSFARAGKAQTGRKPASGSTACKDFEASSLPEAVREWLEHSEIAKRGTKSARVRICLMEGGTDIPAEEQVRGAQQLRQLMRDIASQPGSLTSPLKVDTWFEGSSVKRATKIEFQAPIHASYANDFILQSSTDFELRYNPTAVPIRVHGHPWMSITSYSPNVTLNNAEIAALLPTATFFDSQMRFYNNGTGSAPFPDSPRLQVQDMHQDAFDRSARGASINPRRFHLHYVRYYLLGTAPSLGHPKPQPLLAHAYSAIGSEDLRINFSFI